MQFINFSVTSLIWKSRHSLKDFQVYTSESVYYSTWSCSRCSFPDITL